MTKRLDQLPTRVRSKIDAVTPAASTGCWNWTGSMRKATIRQRTLAPVPERTKSGLPRTGRPRGRPRTSETYTSNDRGVPVVHSPEKGYVVPACREVYAQVHEVPYDSFGVLCRCENDLCVNPAHNLPTVRKVPYTGRKAHHGPAKGSKPAAATEMSQAAILEALQACVPRPSTFVSPETAALEAGCGVPTIETWMAFIEWDKAHPDMNEED